MSNDKMKISGKYYVEDWRKLKSEIDSNPDDTRLWEKAYGIFLDRVKTRYLVPINRILKVKSNRGEGFSAVSLHCALIEFLAAIHDGVIYKYKKPDKSKYEYNQSGELFKKFLSSVEPFKSAFAGKENDFYSSVRCGLLHEAATKGNWIITASHSNKLIEATSEKTILNRNQLHKIITDYINRDYKNMLLKNSINQKAFVRKMDSLCKP